MIRAVIFDFNGVLADDDPIHMQALHKVAVEEGIAFSESEYMERYLPLNDRDCFQELWQKNGRDEIRHILGKANLLDCFSTIVAMEDVRRGKPDPEPFSVAFTRLRENLKGLAPEECAAVEDSLGGIQSAQSAGMPCLGVAHSYPRTRIEAAKPKWVIDSISDFSEWLNKV